MKKQITKILLALLTLSSLVVIQPKQVTKAQTAGPNDYFNSLISRSDVLTSNSLRNQTLIDQTSQIKPNPWVTYDSTMDAAKAVIPAFDKYSYSFPTIQAMGSSDDRIIFSQPLTTTQQNLLINQRGIQLDNEILTVYASGTFGTQFPDGSSVLVNRGQFGTTASSHAAGLTLAITHNSLPDQVRVPIGTTDGHTYLFTWDVYYDPSYLGTDINVQAAGHKEFQLGSGKSYPGSITQEIRTRLDGIDGIGNTTIDRSTTMGILDGRNYDTTLPSTIGSNVTNAAPLEPQANRFYFYTGRWIRFWYIIDQRSSALDPTTLWVSDESTLPVKIFDGLTLNFSLYSDPGSIQSWWIEQNSSYDLYRGSTRDLVSYVRNFVALKDISLADVGPLLVQPGSSNIPPSVSLTSPTQGQVFASAPATVNIAANASDSDGTISKVEFYNGPTLLNTDTTSPYSYSWANVMSGTYTVTARAYDDKGVSSSASAQITVGSTSSNLPTASISASPTSINSGQSSTLTWSTSNATSVSIDNGIGTVAASGSTTVMPATTTKYTITATNGSGSTTSSSTITVNSTASSLILSYDGKTRDMVSFDETGVPDGQLDAQFSAALPFTKTITKLTLHRTASGTWDTVPANGYYFLGVTADATSPLVNSGTSNINYTASSFKVYASDRIGSPLYFNPGDTFNLTAVFSDGSSIIGSVVIPSATTLAGDLNSDGIVNSIDWSILNSKWFTSDATADLNHDGLVNSLDWSLMNANWLKTG